MASSGCGEKSNRVARHKPGWLLRLGNEAPSIGVDQCQSQYDDSVPSLQSMCIGALAQALPLYVNEYGIKETASALTLFPSSTLASLSIECSLAILTDGVAQVLGCHSHVERLSLHKPYQEVTSSLDDTTVSYILSRESTRRKTSPEGDCSEPYAPPLPDEGAQGCRVLKRLELVNFHLSTDAFAALLRSCPSITHLSIGNLILPLNGKEASLNQLKSIAQLLPYLEVLDLSHCSWVTDFSLRSFLRQATCSNSGNRLESLHVVNVAGCRSVSELTCLQLNQEFRGNPVISTQVQL